MLNKSAMKYLCSVLLCAFLYAGTASAQETEIRQDILKLMEMTGSQKMVEQVFNQMSLTYKKKYPGIPDEYWENMEEKLKTDELLNLIIPIYEKYYSHEEIKQLIEFYQTPLGQKTIEVMPQVMQESMMAGQKWGAETGRKIMKKLKEDGLVD